VVWHVPGDNPVSGAYRGPVEYLETMPARMGPLDRCSIAVTDVLTNQKDDAALVAFHLEGSCRVRTVDMDGFHMIRQDEAGRIVEAGLHRGPGRPGRVLLGLMPGSTTVRWVVDRGAVGRSKLAWLAVAG
jgi:hypothetical protein